MSVLASVDIQGRVTESVMETFSTMLSMEIAPVETEPPPGTGIQRMVGTLNFAGNVTGIFNVQLTLDFGRRMAASLLGTEPEAVDPGSDVRDLVAEVTNIVGGNLKSALNDAGLHCVLSTPSITYGTDFSIRSLNMDRFERFVFQCDGQVLIVETGLKAHEGADSSIDFSSPNALSRIPDVDLEKLNALDYRRRISDAVVDVFATMFSMDLAETETVSAESLTGKRNVSSVCFAGDATGIVSLHVGEDLSRRMAAGMLGIAAEEIEGNGEIVDMLGELGNIVGGNLKSALTDTGLRCALSTPSFTTGSDFMIESLNLERYERFAFRHGEEDVFVEMGVKVSELARASAPTGRKIHYTVQEAATATPPGPAAPEPAPPEAPAAGGEAPVASQPAAAGLPPVTARRGAEKTTRAPEDFGLELLLDIPVELTVELGRTRMPIHELMKLAPGSAVKLAKLEGEPVDILANDVLIARGEVVVRNEKYGIRITEITSRIDRLKGLR